MDRAEYVDAQLRKLTMGDLTDDQLQKLYTWIDEIPLSRPKRNIARDFADGVLVAEIVSHYFPRLVELHNYSAANSYAQKIYNWNTLNTKARVAWSGDDVGQLSTAHAQRDPAGGGWVNVEVSIPCASRTQLPSWVAPKV